MDQPLDEWFKELGRLSAGADPRVEAYAWAR
jgi:hypothetical protein